tara:strand:+ start:175 stop:441 length:267 start_codon:yes stop_codon:yes gene_type:complete
MNITKEMIKNEIEYLNEKYDLRLSVGYAYGKCILEWIENNQGGKSDISYRGTKRQIYDNLIAIHDTLYFKNRKKQYENRIGVKGSIIS